MWLVLLLFVVVLVAGTEAMTLEGTLRSVERAFSGEECRRIEALFESTCDVEVDARPDHGILRRNYWLKTKAQESPPELEWVLGRVGEVLNERGLTSANLEFALMHEFLRGEFFDWHVDTKPADGTGRTVNVNVVLSTTFRGGELEIGLRNATLGLGDLHAYPAALPHKVHDVVEGKRRTLVLAFRGPDEARRDYWAAMRDFYAELCSRPGAAPKLHWIFGEFHQAMGEPIPAMAKFAESYRATPQREDYARAFADAAAEKHANGRPEDAVNDLEMCLAIAGSSNLEYAADLAVVYLLLSRPLDADRVLAAAIDAHPDSREIVPLHVTRSLALDGPAADAALRRARDLDADLADEALAQLRALLSGE